MAEATWGRQPVGDVLKSRRIHQAAIAVELGIPFTTFSFQLRGYTWPTPELRAALSDRLGLPESELFTEQVLTSPRPKTGPKPRAKAVAS